ncbi:MAG: hypothetical protein RSB70_04935 [Clostridium sp.]
MKYIGPFLRINSLSKDNIKSQLFFLSKESLKHIALESHCGVVLSPNELVKANPNIDINTVKKFSPLLCVYKKSSAKLVKSGNKLQWDSSRFKKDVNVLSNSLMTLSLLELSDYYSSFNGSHRDKLDLGNLYSVLTRHQLEFYALHLRNTEGVFVDKTDCSDPLFNDLKFESRSRKFKFYEQALLMCAYYRYSTLFNDEYSENFRNFSLDILNMFHDFKDEVYESNFEDKVKLCLSLNLFITYSHNKDAESMLLDLSDMIISEQPIIRIPGKDDDVQLDSLAFINYILLYKNTGINKFKDVSITMYESLVSKYNDTMGIFVKNSDEKSIEYSSDEIISYLGALILYSDIMNDEKNDALIADYFKKSIIDSSLVLSWPETPGLNDPEHYINFSLKAEDLISEQNFRIQNTPTPSSSELAPIFIKYISFNKKRDSFKNSKPSFDSNKNMFIFFLSIFLKKYKF